MGAPQIHDQYGKHILRTAFPGEFTAAPPFSFGDGAGSATIDGLLNSGIAVEIESRVNKQVRGALLDLALHPSRKKLLLVMNVRGNDITPRQAEEILRKICPPRCVFKVVTLDGNGALPCDTTDVRKVKAAVKKLNQESARLASNK